MNKERFERRLHELQTKGKIGASTIPVRHPDESGHWHEGHYAPKPQAVSSHESEKTVDIQDAVGNLRYKVKLTSYDIQDDIFDTLYEITVVNCYLVSNPLIILTYPASPDVQLVDYNEALQRFNSYVEQYSNLVRAETRDLQDINALSLKSNYTLTCPKCCATCEFASKHKTDYDHIIGVTGELECLNPQNDQTQFFDNYLDPKLRHRPRQREVMMLHPRIQALGVCDNYVQRTKPQVLNQGDSIGKVIDWKLNQMITTPTYIKSLSSAIDSTISSSIGDIIVPAVGIAIDKQLSGDNLIIEGNRDLNVVLSGGAA